MNEPAEPWVECESCERRSPPELDPYEDTILHDCAADEWVGVEFGGTVRGPYSSLEGMSKGFRSPTRQLGDEEIARHRERVRGIFEEAAAEVEARLSLETGSEG